MVGSALDLDVQKFLKSFRDIETGIETLVRKFAINVYKDYLEFGDGTWEDVWIFNYDQLKSKGDLKIENECRGLILNHKCDIVSLSFTRFFNDTDKYAAEIDWESANAEFKHDGTLVVIYTYRGDYFIQTRGRANADGFLPGDPTRTYNEAVMAILQKWAEKKDGDPFGLFKKHNINDSYTWAFEYVGPDNRIITPYKEDDLILIAAFDKYVPAEVKSHYVDQFAFEYDIKRPDFRRVPSVEAAYELLDYMDVLEEGVVISDHRCRRLKVKKPSYRTMARIENTAAEDLNAIRFAEIVLAGDARYVSKHYPEYSPILDFFDEVLVSLMEELQTVWLLYRVADSRKTFAEHVKRNPFSSILFLAWDGKIKDMQDAIKYIKPKQLVDLATDYHPATFNKSFETAVKAKMAKNAGRSEKETKTKHASSET